jgi:NAD(P)-dependent dehydrogenase (short-subunit alcohol dehydrogenase family)
MSTLHAKIAVVTGAGSGIGRATALRLASLGATVVAADIDSAAGEALVAQSLSDPNIAIPGRIVFRRVDVCVVSDIEALMNFAGTTFGGIDIVFNNAGAGGAPERIDEIDAEGWDRTMNLLLRSVAMGIRYAVPHMLARGGSIINTASVAALSSGMAPTAYSVAKAGVLHLSKVAAADLARHRIRVNAICPGFIQTNIFSSHLTVTAEQRAAVKGLIAGFSQQAQPVARGGEPEDIAGTVAFLASDDAAFITGTHILVDGGLLVGPRPSWDPTAPRMGDAIRALVDNT